jgi:hypothetical protein
MIAISTTAHFRPRILRRLAVGLVVGETAVLIVSYTLILTPGLTRHGHVEGIPVHDDILPGLGALTGLGMVQFRY